MSFAAPQLLLCLIAVPIVAVLYLVFERRRAARSTAWSRPAMLPNISSPVPRRLGLLPVALFLLGVTLLLVGFARPQRASSSNGNTRGPTLVLAFDVSGSMAASDMGDSRLRAARALAINVLQKLPSNYEVAVVTFGNKVRLTVAPTLNRKEVIAHLPTSITPKAGTSIGDGIASSVATITEGLPQGVPVDRLHPPGAMLLLTDGAQTGGGVTPADAASTAFVFAIPINAVIVGTSKGSVRQAVKVNGFRTAIEIAVPALNFPLQSISQQTGGAFFAAASRPQLAAVADKLPAALKSETLSPTPAHAPRENELSAAVGGIGLALVLGGIFLSGLWFGRLS